MLGTGVHIGIDSMMYFGIGFLVCALFALIPIPFVHARAVRLTERRLDAANPISTETIQTEKDMMRAEFAMTARRLESSIEELKNKTSAHMTELAKKASIITKLRSLLDERDSTIAKLETNQDTLEGRSKAMFDELQIAKTDIATRNETIFELERSLGIKTTEITGLTLAVEQRSHVIERQNVEIAALKSHIDIVRHRVAEFANEVRESEDKLAHEWVDLMRVASPSLGNGAHSMSNGAKRHSASNGQATAEAAE